MHSPSVSLVIAIILNAEVNFSEAQQVVVLHPTSNNNDNNNERSRTFRGSITTHHLWALHKVAP
jgi:hypothetical protein